MKKTKILAGLTTILLICSFAYLAFNTTSAQATVSFNFGNTMVGSATHTAGSYQINVYKYQATQSGTLNSLNVYCGINTGTPALTPIVYSDNNNSPNTLLGQGSSTTVKASMSWQTLNGLNIQVANGAYYWLGWRVTGGIIQYSSTATGQSTGPYLFWQATSPNPFGTPMGYDQWQASIYATVTSSVNPTPTPSTGPSPTPTQSPKSQSILCFGDSITQGYSNGVTITPYPTTLQSDTGISTTNAGVGGETTSTGLTRFTGTYASQGYTKDVFLEGINDGDIWSGNSVTSTESNLQGMWQSALNSGATVYALTILPSWGAVNVVTINNWIKATAPTMGVHIVDTYADFNDPNNPMSLNPIYDSGDGTHPNQAGANLIANTVYLAMNNPTPTPTTNPTPTPTPTASPSPTLSPTSSPTPTPIPMTSEFSISTNTVLSNIAFDLTHSTFSATSTSGTIQLTIAKSVLPTATTLTVTINNTQKTYTYTSSGNNWVVTIVD